ncbi:quinol:cytochrome c oxidoreductase pentaheme cytochrome subunit [Pricia antarctica]|uniref:Quinol:cytochrome c oxidoreductase pentaheme cytochrome subunit n=1 Tax=Pricia antarctica TaxID=641691 RepID=A0A1G7AJV8_9FLAO|nr:c-type cytochrome [Pricia antarctica]SDE15033.1 quinol:cytochrome c oxidoreductase pentaheme cytochrome subunit [Pricia antarctica]
MQKLSYRHRISRVVGIGILFFLLFSLPICAQQKAVQDSTSTADSEQADSGGSEDSAADTDGDPAAGKQIFNQNCAACHALDRKMTGPALGNVEQKIQDEAGLGRDWIYKWIKNSAGLISSGDEYANKIYNQFNQVAMTAFPTLSNEDIDNILAYTNAPPKKAADAGADQAAAGGGGGGSASSGISNEIILGALALVFGLLVAMLFLVNKTLQRIAAANGIAVEKDESEKRLPIWKAFAKNQFLVFVSVVLLLLGGAYFAYGWMMQIGVDQGYEPIQPIHYSHRIHAGENKIECKYCHSSARVSKHSGIPSLNVCMNCHKSIYEVADETLKKGKQEYGVDYNKEIKKLYAAVGWDEENQKYTGESQPVEWIRIHNLPDFAYFNHSQHHIVGGIQCQECHGPVEEMEIMYQYSPLTMGWCINCHRETNVKVEGNAYYDKIHEQLAKKYGVETFTVAQMGGIECGKCHY